MQRQNLKYILLSLGENIKGFGILVGCFKNWYDFVSLKIGLADSAFLVSSLDGELKNIAINKPNHTITITYGNNKITFSFASGRQLDNAMRNIYQNYIEQQYRSLNVKGRKVIDIGANNGDSAIYFIMRGASMVYAYEPYPHSYAHAVKNVKINGMQDKVLMKNMAVSGSTGSIILDDKYDSINNSILKGSEHGKKIPITNLNHIVNRYKLRNTVLKMDCEGSEYEILANASDKTLKSFSQVAIEYHFGPDKIVKRLKNLGFRVSYTKPKVVNNSETNGLRMEYGMIFANR